MVGRRAQRGDGALPGEPSPAPVRRLDRATLIRAASRLGELDADLGAVVERHGVPPLWARPPGFATLLRIILEQQVSLASARAAFGRIEAGLGSVTPERVAECGVAGLRRLGLTRQKAGYCCELAERVRDGNLDLRRLARAADERAREELRSIRGVGPWTADIYLLMALRRPDVWPAGDLALLTALQAAKGLRRRPSPTRAARLARRWMPWRAVAARILWHGYLSGSLAGA